MMVIRQLVAIVALPFVVVVLIPLRIARRGDATLAPADSAPRAAAQLAGVVLLLIGAWLFTSSLRRFVIDGRGTLAPWDPPRTLVVRGPYRRVRNPMISGVVCMLFAEALVLGSRVQLEWAVVFLLVNAVYIPLLEEPFLRARFGADYDEYCRNVPRLFPRFHPWHAKGDAA